MQPSRAIQVVVHGRVQGVGFRAWVERQAELRGLGGWVRNRLNGTVEAVVIGPPDTVEAMLAALHEGPSGARVDRVEVLEAEPGGLEAGRFEVKRTV